MSTAIPLTAHENSEQKIEAMERDGFVYLPNILNPDEVAELRQLSVQLEPSAEALDIDLTLESDRDPLFLKYFWISPA